MPLEVPTAAGLMYSDTVVEGLRDRYRCIVPGLPFGAHTTPMPDDLFRSWIHPPLRDLTEPRLSPLSTRDALSNLRLRRRDSDEVRVAGT